MYFGRLEDAIWALRKSDWEVFHEIPYCLVTCVDSSVEVKFMITAAKTVELVGSCSFLGKALLVSDGQIADVAKSYNLFNGFDEIWLYKDRPVLEKPATFSIVGPLDLARDPLPRGLVEWFSASGCVLGLGDGTGMNYVTTSKEMVESLNARQQIPGTTFIRTLRQEPPGE